MQPPSLQVVVVFAHDVTSRGHLARRRCPYKQALPLQAGAMLAGVTSASTLGRRWPTRWVVPVGGHPCKRPGHMRTHLQAAWPVGGSSFSQAVCP
ncbi:hypothetical protein BHE74_00049854 [Ensete ventricosum]|nr:hypothetical protein BHE74_00049854 [Ensete ventricosum]RZS04208.1 hypothetical protein BHM03_00034517 [Ensete ventricosum]